jgi:hypothetical protein
VSWATPTGPVRRDPASSGVVVVRHSGQVGQSGDAPDRLYAISGQAIQACG